MTQKHFILIAAVVRTLPSEVRGLVATAFADRLGREFPKFNRDIFIRAATG